VVRKCQPILRDNIECILARGVVWHGRVGSDLRCIVTGNVGDNQAYDLSARPANSKSARGLAGRSELTDGACRYLARVIDLAGAKVDCAAERRKLNGAKLS
jgi:hypothetical protein